MLLERRRFLSFRAVLTAAYIATLAVRGMRRCGAWAFGKDSWRINHRPKRHLFWSGTLKACHHILTRALGCEYTQL